MMTVAGLSALALAAQAGASQFAWTFDAEAGNCGFRQQGPSGQPVLWVSNTPANDRGFSVSVEIPKRPGDDDWEPLQQVRVAFDAGGEGLTSGHIYPGANPKLRRVVVGIDDEGRRRFARARTITVSHATFAPVVVPIRSGQAVVDAMTRCEDGSMRKWGIDPVAWRSLQSPPQPSESPSSWITFNDLPISALRSRVGAELVTRLQVDSAGRVADCTVLEPKNARGFRENVCRIFRLRGKFAPARDAQGRPVAAPYMIVVRYKF